MPPHDMTAPTTYLGSAQAAQRLGVSTCTLLRAVRCGELAPVGRTPRGAFRFRAVDLDAYARRRPPGSQGSQGSQGSRRPTDGSAPRDVDRHALPAPDPAARGLQARVPSGQGLQALATVAAEDYADPEALIADILTLLAESLHVGLTFLSRVERDTLYVERVHDRAGMGLRSGTVVPLCDTYCQATLARATRSLVVEDVRSDPRFAALPPTHLFGVGAYSGVPLYHSDGRLYGTLCTLHPRARTTREGETALLQVAGRLIVQAIETAAGRREERRLVDALSDHADEVAARTEDLAVSEKGFRLLFAANPLPMWVYDTDTLRFLEVNEAAIRYYGYTREEFARMRISDIRPESDADALWEAVRRGVTAVEVRDAGHWRHRLKDGRLITVAITTHTLTFGGRAAALVLAQDITERQRMEEELRHQALHDALTGLPNRALLQDRLNQALRTASRLPSRGTPGPLALLLLDLDRFKEVNDTLGHHRGDLLLRHVAERLCATLRDSDTVARLGGDEFAVLLPATDHTGAHAAAEKIAAALALPFDVENLPLHVGVSIGIALAPAHGEDAETLLRHADVAMYIAKREGETWAVYAPERDAYTPDRLALTADLRRAIADGDLLLHYQPKVDLATKRITGVEALVRWTHPARGPIPPDGFIPLAERTGLIAPLTRWVLGAALLQAGHWRRAGLHLDMSINLSMVDLRDPGLPDALERLLRAHAVPPTAVRLEVTESALMTDPACTQAVLVRLAALGVGLSVDDYGTGYSSLAYLKRLPVDELKIDRSFVRHMAADAADAAIVSSTIGLGHALGLRVVAEGVEDRETWTLLADAGCDTAQGYYLARPLPAADVERWARETSWSVA